MTKPGPTRSLPARRLQTLVLILLTVGLFSLNWATPLSWPTAALVGIATLKLREARSLGERRLVSLLQLLAVGLLAAQDPGLLPSAWQLLLTLLSLAGLLQLELHQRVHGRHLLRQSGLLLTAALPMALVLFLLVPRIGPIWNTPGLAGGLARTGLSEQLDPGSISSLVDNQAIAARVAFSDGQPPATGESYWRVLVHERFDGRSWQRRNPVPTGRWMAPSQATGRRELWLVEADGLDAVPWDGRSQPAADTLRLRINGELVPTRSRGTRLGYTLIEHTGGAPWQSWPPGPEDLDLPAGAQPRLEALGSSWREITDPRERLEAAAQWFQQNHFLYSRSPGRLPDRAALDSFLFDRREGFCGHYASAFTALMRAAGVPARVVSGYRGGTWVRPLGAAPYLEIRQSAAHAWSEAWLSGQGWVTIDPSLWAAGGAVPAPLNRHDATATEWWLWGQRQWAVLDISWSRWWLGFDGNRQAIWMERWFAGRGAWLGLVILLGVGAGLAVGLVILNAQRSGSPRSAANSRELSRLLALLARHGLNPAPGDTLDAFLSRVRAKWPAATSDLKALNEIHQTLRFGRPQGRAAQRSEIRRLAHLRRRLTAFRPLDTVKRIRRPGL
jgi:transglutaminase-like putative cysteine protease